MRVLEVRYLERVALGTPYTAVAKRVRRLVQDEQLAGQVCGGGGCDGSGGSGGGSAAGGAAGVRGDGGFDYGRGAGEPDRVGVECAEAGFDCGGAGFAGARGLKIARGLRDSWALVKELMDVRMTFDGGAGRVRLGADGGGEHDDLVIAVALACWKAGQARIGFGDRRLPGI